jgi:acyl-CoA thioester hydrolase
VTQFWRERVVEEWIDYNGHLSEPFYVLVFGNATTAVMDEIGIDPRHREERNASLYTVEAHVRYLDQVPLGAQLEVRSELIGRTGKLLWIWHEMWSDGRLRATEEILGVYVIDEHSAGFPEQIAEQIDRRLVAPVQEAGRAIRI